MATMTQTTTEIETYESGRHYIELSNPIKEAAPVIVFFSFLDSESKEWALKYNITNTIRRRVPMGTYVDRYHVSAGHSMELGKDLSEAWAVARSLSIDDKVLEPLYTAVQDSPKITDMQGVKAVFEGAGIPPLRFDREYAKRSVHAEVKWMEEVYKRTSLQAVPAVVVRGRYLVQPESFGEKFDTEVMADLVRELLQLS